MAVRAKSAYLIDMSELGMFQPGRVPSEYNRADPGTKHPKSVPAQDWFRALLNLQYPTTDPDGKFWRKRVWTVKNRRDAWLATNGPAPLPSALRGDGEGDHDPS